MGLSDAFLLAARWLHLLGAAAWIGGSIFYLLVLRPALARVGGAPDGLARAVANEFRALVITSVVVLTATGVILAVNRLTVGVVGAPYAVTLGVKVVLSIWMFVLVLDRRRRRLVIGHLSERPRPATTRLGRMLRLTAGYNAVLILGVVVFLLSDLLKVLFELALSAR